MAKYGPIAEELVYGLKMGLDCNSQTGSADKI
jgi:hypothetical protein